MATEETDDDDDDALFRGVDVGRLIKAVLVAAGVPATILAVWGMNDITSAITTWVIVFLVALAHAVGLGLPGFLVLNRFNLNRWWVSLIGGFVIGALPYSIFFWTSPLHAVGTGLFGMAGGFSAWLVYNQKLQSLFRSLRNRVAQ